MSAVRKIELLAPAKDLATGIAAIDHGADAVYIGGPEFGARYNASNTVEEIKELASYAHRFGAQLFVTLNTILKDEELPLAEKMAWQMYQAGVDALIVQDMGILKLDLPPIALHASTQTDNRTPEKVNFLNRVGFSQIVLARELSLQEIRQISAKTDAILEFFIHGALCVSYSGQCWISEAVTGRSANRGNCAQMCRLPGTLTDQQGDVLADDTHLLSLKDMDQTDNLEALIDAGIQSFKIEGRLKDINYVKNVTAWYRQKLDAIIERRSDLQRASMGRCQFNFTPDPNKTFSRGGTDYFLNGRSHEITSFRSPRPVGESIGKVKKLGQNWLEISSSQPLNNGDGLSFFNPNNELMGLRVNRADGNRLYTNEPIKKLRVGDQLFRNLDHQFVSQLNKASSRRKIGIQMVLAETGSGYLLTAENEHGARAQANLDADKQIAKDPQKNLELIRQGLAKLGNTPFVADQIELSLNQSWFIPKGMLNGLRRELCERLEAAQVDHYQRPERLQPDAEIAEYPQASMNYRGNVYNELARSFYQEHGVQRIDPAFEQQQPERENILMITKHCLRYSYNLCPKEVEGIKAEPMTLKLGPDEFRLRFDCRRCEMHIMGHGRK